MPVRPFRKPISGGALIWIIVGLVVAGGHDFLNNLSTLSSVLSAGLAVLVWPFVLFHIHFGI